TWLYLVWSLAPIIVAVLFSFNNGKSQSVWQGFSWRWYFSDPVNSVLHNPQLHAAVIQTVRLSVLTTVIAVPIGVAFALGINRWRGPVPATFNFVMILSYVVPELIFGVSMFFVFTTLFAAVHLGTTAEVLGLVTWNVSWSAIGVQARLVTLGRQYEEAAADLGASQFQVIRRVMLPLLAPAIFASAVLVFSGMIDDFVIVDLLSSSAGNPPMSLIIVIIGYVGYRLLTRGERGSGLAALTTIAGEGSPAAPVPLPLSRTKPSDSPAVGITPESCTYAGAGYSGQPTRRVISMILGQTNRISSTNDPRSWKASVTLTDSQPVNRLGRH